jgi:hypothetical protein
MPRETHRLHLMQASMQWRDTDAQTRADFDRILTRGADVIGMTEVSERNRNLRLLRDAAKPTGYQVFNDAAEEGFAGGETAIAVRKNLDVRSHGAELVNEPEAGKPPAAGHSARLIQWVEVIWEGNRVFVFEAHWVTGFGRRPSRTEKHRKMTDAIIELVQRNGRGTRLAFFMGDVNLDEETDRGRRQAATHARFTEAGLTTVWDELAVYPGTHGNAKTGGTIDIIGSYDPDRRVSADSVRVWRKLNSDHLQVSAWYDVLAPHKPIR